MHTRRQKKRSRATGFSMLLTLALCCILGGSAFAERTYTVKKRDTLGTIAAKYDMRADDIARYNDMSDPNMLRVGQVLKIPPISGAFKTYKVQKGDVLSTIADRFEVSMRTIMHANRLSDPDQLKVGQALLIPLEDNAKGSHASLPGSLKARLDRIPVWQGRWQYIVIHHSGSARGSVKGMDRYHREERHMENGLAYHFVIGNGRGMGNGAIAMGDRWLKQLNGGHLASEKLNRQAIGICLVGNFDKTHPTAEQLDSLEALTRYLMMRCELSSSRVQSHTEINTKPTRCPGKRFPMRELKRRIR